MASSKTSDLRWVIAGLLFLETILNYVDFQTLAVVAPSLRKELDLSAGDYARATQAFQVANVITFLIGGWILDRIGVRWGMALAIAWWSAAEMMHGFVDGARSLAGYRFLFGFAYPGAYLAAAKAVSEWYPPRERALGIGIYTAGATVGATVAPPLIAWLADAFGWRYAFVTAGAAGFVYLIPWLLIYRRPHQPQGLADANTDDLDTRRGAEGKAEPTPSAPWGIILKSRYFWAVVLGRMIGDSPWIFYVNWVPLLLDEQYGLSLTQIGAITWVPFLFADLGSLGGGWLSGRFVRRGWAPVRARLLLMGCSACVLAFSFTLGQASSPPVIIVLLSLMTLFTMTWMVNQSTIVIDSFPSELVGRVVGLTTAAAVLGQFLMTSVIGYCFDRHLYQMPFIIMSFMAPVAYVVVRLILRKQSFRPAPELVKP